LLRSCKELLLPHFWFFAGPLSRTISLRSLGKFSAPILWTEDRTDFSIQFRLVIAQFCDGYWFNVLALQCLLYFPSAAKWLNSRYLTAPSEEEGSCKERESGLQTRHVCPDDPSIHSGEGDRRAFGRVRFIRELCAKALIARGPK
jgi:hypothetical protein